LQQDIDPQVQATDASGLWGDPARPAGWQRGQGATSMAVCNDRGSRP